MVQLADPPSYKIRYSILKARSIYNRAGPYDWLDPIEEQEKGWEWIRKENSEKDDFYFKLEKDVLENGFRNPIFIVSGFMTGWMYDELPQWSKDNLLVCDRLGGSRLWVGQKHDLDIPCIISDFNDRFDDLPDERNRDVLRSYFKDQPPFLSFNKYGVMAKFPLIRHAEDEPHLKDIF